MVLDFREFLHSANSFADDARDAEADHSRKPMMVAATIFAWCAIESFVNSMLADFASIEHLFKIHERALLLDKRVSFKVSGDEAGSFVLEATQHWSIEQKILFLLKRFGGRSVVQRPS